MKHFMNIVPVAGLAAVCMAVCLCSCAGHSVDSLSLEKVKQQGLSQRFAPAVETPHEF